MHKRLLLLGGGHAHMMTLANLDRFTDNGFEAVVVQPSPYHYYSGMGPGMLGSTYEPDQIRFDTRRLVEQRGGIFIENAAVHIDPVQRSVTLSDDSKISYDVLSCNTGSHVAATTGESDSTIIPAKPIAGLVQARQTLAGLFKKKSAHIAVIGGGPSAVEMACNVRQLAERFNSDHIHITLFGGRQVFHAQTPGLQRIVARYLDKRKITVIEGSYVESVAQGLIKTDRGEQHHADLTFVATGVSPSPLFQQSGLAEGDGEGLAVNEYLQSIYHDNIFGGGDCIDFITDPLDKVGVYAVRQNPVLLHNLLAQMKGETLKPFTPGGGYMLVYNMGGGQGILVKGPLVFSGSTAFRIKDYIDRRFMRTYLH